MDYVFLSRKDRGSAQRLVDEVFGRVKTTIRVNWGEFWGSHHYVCVRTQEPDDGIVRVGYSASMEGYYLGTINRVWGELKNCRDTLGSFTVHPAFQRFDRYEGGFVYPSVLPKKEFEILLKGPVNVY